MHNQLNISVGQFSHKGVKPVNQDFHGALLPTEPQNSLKGAVVALADGISSSDVSHIASETAISSFLCDYYCTSEAWSVRTSGTKVIESINGWLASQTQKSEARFNKDKGHVCTFSAAIFKAFTVHLFHVGDTRIYRLRRGILEQLTKDHRAWISKDKSYLSRALGVNYSIVVDYQSLSLETDDIFLLCSDGVYEYWDTDNVLQLLQCKPLQLDDICKEIVLNALKKGSQDNLTLQMVKVEQLPGSQDSRLPHQINELTVPPVLSAGELIDGYRILRQLHANSRSHVYHAEDTLSQHQVVIKIPSVDMRDDPAYLERFLLEEWVARRINHNNVMKAAVDSRPRHYLFTVTEFIEGVTLSQWLLDHPNPNLETVRNFTEQIARGLYALHKLEILHQDLRPENIMVDNQGRVKIIDFGGVRVAGLRESNDTPVQESMQGTALYMAPEYFVGSDVSQRSDQYSLAVITYFMLSGRFPYGVNVAKARTMTAQKRLVYQSVLDDEREIPAWVDYALRKALSVNPYKRYEALSELIHELRQPNPKTLNRARPPLIERNPLLVWKSLSLFLLATVIGLLVYINHIAHPLNN